QLPHPVRFWTRPIPTVANGIVHQLSAAINLKLPLSMLLQVELPCKWANFIQSTIDNCNIQLMNNPILQPKEHTKAKGQENNVVV
ncbi:hypothetical protein ACHAWX_003563, partial [Stephanocyclus meneghinianus]